MSQSREASTHRLEPSLIALSIIRPVSISTSAWVGRPASKIRAAPPIRLASPDVMAASCSTYSPGMSSDIASGTPSADTTAA